MNFPGERDTFSWARGRQWRLACARRLHDMRAQRERHDDARLLPFGRSLLYFSSALRPWRVRAPPGSEISFAKIRFAAGIYGQPANDHF